MPPLVLPVFGKAMETALTKMRGRATQQLLTTLENAPDKARGLLVSFASGAYTDGSLAGFYVHGSYLGAKPSDLKQGRLKGWIDRGEQFGEFAVGRLEDMLNTGSNFPLTRWAGIVGEAGVWRGQDESGLELGKEYEVEWKTWVRVWGRSEHRSWHDRLEGVTIPVDDYFVLPGGRNAGQKVYGPRDWDKLANVGEWINCGHALTFSKTATGKDLQRTREARVNQGQLETLYQPTGTPTVPTSDTNELQWSQAKPGDVGRNVVAENLELATRAWKDLGVTARVDPNRWKAITGVAAQDTRRVLRRDIPVFYDQATDTLLLNQHSGLWAAPEKFARDAELGGDSLPWITQHERNHALTFRSNRALSLKLKNARLQKAFRADVQAQIGWYATTNMLEFFAEAYAGSKTGKVYSGRVKEVFESLLKSFGNLP